MKRYLNQAFPGVEVIGENYPASDFNQNVASIVSAIKFTLIAFLLTGDTVFERLGVVPPALWMNVRERKIPTALIIFMMGNMLSSNLLATGAFEVSLENELIFSKLETGQQPSIQLLRELIGQKLRAH